MLYDELSSIVGHVRRLVLPQRILALTDVTYKLHTLLTDKRVDEKTQKETEILRKICFLHLMEAIEELSSDLMDENQHAYLDEHVTEVKRLSEELALLHGFGLPQFPEKDEECE